MVTIRELAEEHWLAGAGRARPHASPRTAAARPSRRWDALHGERGDRRGAPHLEVDRGGQRARHRRWPGDARHRRGIRPPDRLRRGSWLAAGCAGGCSGALASSRRPRARHGAVDAEAAAKGWERPVVYAHEDLPSHFRRYEQTGGWNTAINRRQFAIDVPQFSWPSEYCDPDVAYAKHLTFTRDDLTFELHHAWGETDDATWTWVPEKNVLHPGDLFIRALPNADNPQKVQSYVSDWGAALRQMASLCPEMLLVGHCLPIFGADRIVAALTDTAELLESVESQTLAIMNQGKDLDTCLHEVTVSAHLADKPCLQAVYDHPQFLIRNVWRRYGGWWDGEPDNLLPSPRAQRVGEWVGGWVGGIGWRRRQGARQAQEVLDGGDARLACHLVEFAALAAPENADVWTARAEVYAAHAAQHTSSMARYLLRHASIASEQGERGLAAGDY